MTTVDPAADKDFLALAEPVRRELLAHCYRMLGSVHDAEDMVQETYLRAWKAYDRFEGRSSVRTWLYSIATRTCLTALDGRGKRPLPTGLGGPGAGPDDKLVERPEVPWLEPIPDAMLTAAPDDPASIVTSRESVRLALVAALQFLPPRQRAVLLLRDVLAWKAAEVAELLETTTAAVNSSLQRARAQLDEVSPTEEAVTEPTTARQRELLDRYVKAFEAKDIPAIIDLFTSDAVWEMPPFTSWYRGGPDIARLVDTQCTARSTCPCSPCPRRASPTSRASSTCRCSRPSGCPPSCGTERARPPPPIAAMSFPAPAGLPPDHDEHQGVDMGLIHIEMFATLDLVGQAPGGPDEDPDGFAFGGWQAPLVDEVAGAQMGAAYEGTDALLLGRRTYDIFASFWPHQGADDQDGGIAALFNSIPKYVASRGTPDLPWAGSTHLGPDLPAAIREVRDRHENVKVVGSLDLVQTLLREKLFDRLDLWIHPILLGVGKKVFEGGTVPTNITLLEPPAATPKGTVHLRYGLVDGTPATGDMSAPGRGVG